MNGELQQMRLRQIVRANFRKSEATLLAELIQEVGENNFKLGKNDCVLLVSTGGTVLRFIYGWHDFDMIDAAGNLHTDAQTRVLPSKTLRILHGGSWNPYMLANYAEQVGIDLAKVKRFESYLKEEIRQAASS